MRELGIEPGKEPEAAILPVAEEMILDAPVAMMARLDLFLHLVAYQSRLRGQTVVQQCQHSRHRQTDNDQRKKNPVKTLSGAEHGDDFVAPGHLGHGVKKRQQQPYRDAQDKHAGNLKQVKLRDQLQRGAITQGGNPCEKIRQVHAQIPDQPNGDKPADAVKKREKKFL